MRKRKDNREETIRRATKAIEAAGWRIIRIRLDGEGRYVASKRTTEPEDDSVTTLFESDHTIEGLKVLVERREREENR